MIKILFIFITGFQHYLVYGDLVLLFIPFGCVRRVSCLEPRKENTWLKTVINYIPYNFISG